MIKKVTNFTPEYDKEVIIVETRFLHVFHSYDKNGKCTFCGRKK